ncbi:acetyl-CoA acyltransferase [Streptomyces viridiviolaceus]|uniref:Uncharacterized protein n=1 Tax=Streptomyces viridiviolaceus TaxID=68282 RepID=A0ABW2E7F6_9ACTN|nr:hypothetical protein [Streptomyces viridiviolaceus]GHB67587.1 acetyl-CoA acyltransferase [Streptomyces viridiviolaceus]
MHDVVIVDAVRSPLAQVHRRGRGAGNHVGGLLAQTTAGLLRRVRLEPAAIGGTFGAGASLKQLRSDLCRSLSEIRDDAIVYQSGSSMEAAQSALQWIQEDPGAVALVVSVNDIDARNSRADGAMLSGEIQRGLAAELVAARWKLSRDDLDEYAARSCERSYECAIAGDYAPEIVPIVVPADERTVEIVTGDELRSGAGLADLEPAFHDTTLGLQHPEVRWSVTTGNSAAPAAGACAMLMMSSRRARELRLRPRAHLRALTAAPEDSILGVAGPPVTATKAALQSYAGSVDQIDHFEIPETYASTVLAWQAEFKVMPDLLNPRGGALAMGRLAAADGMRALVSMLGALEATGGARGLLVGSEGRSVSRAMVVERC